jgi:hypothetical protein
MLTVYLCSSISTYRKLKFTVAITILLENICKKKGIKTNRGRKDIQRSLHLRRNYRATTQEPEYSIT